MEKHHGGKRILVDVKGANKDQKVTQVLGCKISCYFLPLYTTWNPNLDVVLQFHDGHFRLPNALLIHELCDILFVVKAYAFESRNSQH